MPTGPLTGVLQHVRRTALLRDGAGQTDGQLLRDYVRCRDETALATLVERHAPMVWGVCCRVLVNFHDAEDAFQGTFLVLVRRAASIASPDALANWLYGVAHQTALKARATVAKRRDRERQVTDVLEPAATEQDLWNDLRPLLDEELSRLPENHRTVLVLCDLEGKTRAEAARCLGVPEGTVGSRLARARVMLAKRLARRGVVLSGGALAAVLSQNVASAGAPVAVVSNAIRAASAFAAGQVTAGPVSVGAAALAEGVLKAMMLHKLKAVVAVALVLGLIAAGAAFSGGSPSARGNQPPAGEPPMPAPQKPDQEKEVFTAWGKEINGLQAGVGLRAGEKRTYRHGETVTLVVRVRNVGKEEVAFQYVPRFLKENPPTVTDGAGKPVLLRGADALSGGARHPSADVTLAPGKEVELYEWKAALRPASDPDRKTPNVEILYGTGTFRIQYERVLGNSTASRIKIDPALSKLATGKLELDVKEPEKQPQKKEEKESFTAWGKEINGLQAGLGFPVGEKRAYHFGDSVKIVARIRNLTKEAIEFEHIGAFFVENAPKILDPNGKVVQLPQLTALGLQASHSTKVPPGGEVALYDWAFDLDAGWKATHGAGTYTLQYERVVGPTSGNPVHPNPKLDKLATGKLELDVKDLTAWGKESNGLQAGLGYRFGEQRAYAHGEEVKIVLRVRNVGKEAVELKRNGGYFIENLPTITNGDGKKVELPKVAAEGRQLTFSTTVAPGKEVEVYEWNIDLRPEGERSKNLVTIHGTGQFRLQCEHIVGPTSGNPVHPHPALDKLATGKLELDVVATKKAEEKPPEKQDPEKAFTVWGKEAGGLQAGLRFLPGERRAAYHHGEKFKLEVKLRNVGKSEVTFTHGSPGKEFTLAVTDIAGTAWTVAMPLPDEKRAPPADRVLKPGETITLAEPVVAVESTDVLKLLGLLRVDTPTMYVDAGKYKVAFAGLLQSHPTLTTGPLEIAVRELSVIGTVVDEDGKPLDGATVTIQRKTYAKGAEEPRIEEFGKTKTDAKGRFEIKSLYAVWETEPRSGYHLTFSAPGMAPDAIAVGKGFDPTKEIKITLKRNQEKEEKEPSTAWGKEINGLQVGLGFPGEKRGYTHGETVKFVIRVRNIGKEEVTFQYLDPFYEHALIVTDGEGKPVPQPVVTDARARKQRDVTLAPGKVIELHEVKRELRPAKWLGNDGVPSLYGTGKFSVQYEGFGGPDLDPVLSKLATGKLELDVNPKKQ